MKIIAAAIAAVASIGCLTAYLAVSRDPVAPAGIRDDEAIREITVPVSPELRSFRPNLELADGSAPVHLMITFKKTDGSTVPGWSGTVKEKCSRKMKIPSGTTEVRISVRKTGPGADVRISRLEPAAAID